MPFHHVAVATRDPKRNHEFYSKAMGFTLQYVQVGKTPEGGWAKHLFYDTGDGSMIAFWDIHDASLPEDWSPAISTGLGLPDWANHLAWRAADRADLARLRERWLAFGSDVVEIDHGWCVSIYTRDPNGITVEFCTTTREFSADDRAHALALLEDPSPAPSPTPPRIKIFRAGA